MKARAYLPAAWTAFAFGVSEQEHHRCPGGGRHRYRPSPEATPAVHARRPCPLPLIEPVRVVAQPRHARSLRYRCRTLRRLHVLAAGSPAAGVAGSRAEEAKKSPPVGAGSRRLVWGFVGRALDAATEAATLPGRREGNPTPGAAR